MRVSASDHHRLRPDPGTLRNGPAHAVHKFAGQRQHVDADQRGDLTAVFKHQRPREQVVVYT